jgi:hypothetical protein
MTKALEKAFAALSKLPSTEQDKIARLIMEDLLWEQKLQTTSDDLTMLANEALAEYKKGDTQPFESL